MAAAGAPLAHPSAAVTPSEGQQHETQVQQGKRGASLYSGLEDDAAQETGSSDQHLREARNLDDGPSTSFPRRYRGRYQETEINVDATYSLVDMSNYLSEIPEANSYWRRQVPSITSQGTQAARSSRSKVQEPETPLMPEECSWAGVGFPPNKLTAGGGGVGHTGDLLLPEASSYEIIRPWSTDGPSMDVRWDSPPRTPKSVKRSASVGPGSVGMAGAAVSIYDRSRSLQKISPSPGGRTTRTIKKADIMISGSSRDLGNGNSLPVADFALPNVSVSTYDLGVPKLPAPDGRVRLAEAGSLLSPLLPQDSTLLRQGVTCRLTQVAPVEKPTERAGRLAQKYRSPSSLRR